MKSIVCEYLLTGLWYLYCSALLGTSKLSSLAGGEPSLPLCNPRLVIDLQVGKVDEEVLVVYVFLDGLWMSIQVALREGALDMFLEVLLILVLGVECAIARPTGECFLLVSLCLIVVGLAVVMVMLGSTGISLATTLVAPGVALVGLGISLVWQGVVEASVVLRVTRGPVPPGGDVSWSHKGAIFLHHYVHTSILIWGGGDRGWLQYVAHGINLFYISGWQFHRRRLGQPTTHLHISHILSPAGPWWKDTNLLPTMLVLHHYTPAISVLISNYFLWMKKAQYRLLTATHHHCMTIQ
ncbi:hypothetical protein E2C01_020543 [Portunus trituberculatus]|uniref:Uncharacterized protein n=1 Tax=Portunus trituberculatus TaxID=210409 RepID=A0A5B7E020_PORTR|nr:hypothetical protein [Portunus trituberculatus]